jgi:D-sedoheptulose 7-phosphate isomerase
MKNMFPQKLSTFLLQIAEHIDQFDQAGGYIALAQATELLQSSYSRGGHLITAGDETLSTKAEHLYEELVGRYSKDRESVPAVVPLRGTSPYRFIELTARCNDCVVIFAASPSPELEDCLTRLQKKGATSVVVAPFKASNTSCAIFFPQAEPVAMRVLSSLILHVLCETLETPPGLPLSFDEAAVHCQEARDLFHSCSKDGNLTAMAQELEVFTQNPQPEHRFIICCGNGGSACDAREFCEIGVAESFDNRGEGFYCIDVSQPGLLTCSANDFGYANIFSRAIEGLRGRLGLIIGISTSGNSENIRNAARTASEFSIPFLFLGGKDGGILGRESSLRYIVPAQRTARIQEVHLAVLCGLAMEIRRK